MFPETRKKVKPPDWAGEARPIVAAAGPLDRRHRTLYRAEPGADRVGCKEQRRQAGTVRDAAQKLQVQQKLAELVDQYNRLNDEQRFEEAETIAKRAVELAPHEMVAQVMASKASIMVKRARERRIRERKENGVANALIDVDEADIPASGEPYTFPDPREMDGHEQGTGPQPWK